jgi:hypothetical protein
MRCTAGGCWVRPGLRNRTGGSPRGGGSCGQMLGVKEQPHKRWLISAGHGRPKRWSVARARHRFISPQSPRAGPCFGPRHGEVGCLPIQPGLQWPHAQPHPKDHLRRNARRWRCGLLIYCSDFRCGHWTAISGDRWPDGVRLSDIERRFTCQGRGQKGPDVRPNFDWEQERRAAVPFDG